MDSSQNRENTSGNILHIPRFIQSNNYYTLEELTDIIGIDEGALRLMVKHFALNRTLIGRNVYYEGQDFMDSLRRRSKGEWSDVEYKQPTLDEIRNAEKEKRKGQRPEPVS